MSKYNISAYIKIMQSGLAEDNKQETAGRLLLNSVAKQDCVQVDVDGKMVTNLVKHKADVHDAIKTASSKTGVIAEAVTYFDREVIPKLNPHTAADACAELIKVLENDTTVSQIKCSELKSLYDADKTDEFLAMCLLYAVSRQNKSSGTPVDYPDMPLLSEVDNECPLCHSPLVKTIKGASVKKYEIVKIYPDDLDDDTTADFTAAKQPVRRLDSNDNKIALCNDCAAAYSLEPEIDEYVTLAQLKELAIHSYEMRQVMANFDLEDDIKTVIGKLGELQNVGNLRQLPMSALRIDEKILPENAILKHSLTGRVLTYYRFIEDTFSQMESSGEGNFNLIASEIKLAYEKFEHYSVSQEDTVNHLANWIMTNARVGLGANYSLACSIVVAFFVQNCEVFHEISK